MDLSKFQNILGNGAWLRLQQEFETQQTSLSQSYLIWTDGSGQQWILADFDNEKTYYINSVSDSATRTILTNEDGEQIVHVSELPDLNEKLKDAQTICDLLMEPQTEKMPQGTSLGFIALIMKLDLREVDLEELKRSNLSGSSLDFESVHQDLVDVHRMFREILSSSSTSQTPLSDAAVQTVSRSLSKFYKIEEEIKDFNVRVEKPTEKHAELLQDISKFYRDARAALDPIIVYVRSTRMGELNTEFRDFFDNAKRKWKDFDAESEAKLQKLDELRIARENQIATTSISDHVKFFDNQAEEHKTSAQQWFNRTIWTALVFIVIAVVLLFFVKPTGDDWKPILNNFFTKGFVISVFYMLLNRSIKNYAAEKHLEVINRHRRNALATFDAFAAASGNNPHTRDQVLLASTNAIFDANQSGYLSTKTNRSDTTSPIQLIIREIFPGKNE